MPFWGPMMPYLYPYGPMGRSAPYYGAPYLSPWAPISKDQEMRMLEEESKILEEQLGEIKKRIDELKKK
ncbi:DUF5320 domain-containing protein [bacterium]|nr:DUF5320 domain-containing protein [bacterium]